MSQVGENSHDRFLRRFLALESSLRIFVRSLGFSSDESREMMQDVAVVLWQKFDPIMSEEDFRRWAFGVAKMEAISARRDRARDRHVFGDDVFALIEKAIIDQTNDQDRERQALADCLKKLPEPQRKLVQAAYFPGVKISELAKQIGKSPAAMYKALERIRGQLIECTQRAMFAEDRL